MDASDAPDAPGTGPHGPRIAVIGGGWAGLAAAVEATRTGHSVTLFEATRAFGGRARTLPARLPDGTTTDLDNGQHILIGAYRHTLDLMSIVGVDPHEVLHAMPLTLQDAEGLGLSLPAWPAPLDLAWGIVTARGWTWSDRASLLRTAVGWRRAGFRCPPDLTVQALCGKLAPRVYRQLVEPLCVAALNTPADQASAQVFLRVLHDALLGAGWGRWGPSWLLLPRAPLGALFPQAAARWLASQGAILRTGHRVSLLAQTATGWLVDGDAYDAVVLACPSWDAARLVADNGIDAPAWLAHAKELQHQAIATVYASTTQRLPAPVLALPGSPQAPAQFVFDRGQLGGPDGLLAFVASASRGDREALEREVLAQAADLGWGEASVVATVVEKRATFACVPGLVRPGIGVAPRLWACGDWVEGPYPATLEGAVMSARRVIGSLGPALSAARRTAR